FTVNGATPAKNSALTSAGFDCQRRRAARQVRRRVRKPCLHLRRHRYRAIYVVRRRGTLHFVSRAQRSVTRSVTVRCRHRSRVYPRSALKCAQVGQARLAWTVTARGGYGPSRAPISRAPLRKGLALPPLLDTKARSSPLTTPDLT